MRFPLEFRHGAPVPLGPVSYTHLYKGSRIINWCPHCITALSDAEVEYVDKPGHLWYIRYPLSDGSGDLVIATTRPETMMRCV